MPDTNMELIPVTGVVQSITPLTDNCCQQQVSIRSQSGITNFIVSPDTYVIQETQLRPGMNVVAFYDARLPIPLIFPPQYQAAIIGRNNPGETVYAGYFDNTLTSADQTLKLNLSRTTNVVTSNGQRYDCNPGDQILIVYYTASTRSIPAQTTPRKIIVLC